MRMTIVIPTLVNNSLEALEYVEERFSYEFGGCTRYRGRGSWMNNDGEIVVDYVWVIETYARAMGGQVVYNEVGETLYNIALTTHELLPDQTTIMYTLDNEAYFTE